MEVFLQKSDDMADIIKAVATMDWVSQEYPTYFKKNAAKVVHDVFRFMDTTNRSISSVELLNNAASLLVNLARSKLSGPMIYDKDIVAQVLQFMTRFVSTEKKLFCTFATYLWLGSQHNAVKKDLSDQLHTRENHKMMVILKNYAERTRRMELNARPGFLKPLTYKKEIHKEDIIKMNFLFDVNLSDNNNSPHLEPELIDPIYFEDQQEAMNCLFQTYNL